MPTAPPTAQTARNRVGVVDAPLAPEDLFAPFGDVVLNGCPLRPKFGGDVKDTFPQTPTTTQTTIEVHMSANENFLMRSCHRPKNS